MSSSSNSKMRAARTSMVRPEGRDAGPVSHVCAAKFALDDHCVVGVMKGEHFQPEIGEGFEETLEQASHCLAAVYDAAHGRDVVAGTAESRNGGSNVVPDGLCLYVSDDDRFANRSQIGDGRSSHIGSGRWAECSEEMERKQEGWDVARIGGRRRSGCWLSTANSRSPRRCASG